MRKRYETKQEQLAFIIEKLKYLKGLKFIDDDEIIAANYANIILRNKVKELNKKEVKKLVKNNT